jgi:chromosome partitioning protein
VLGNEKGGSGKSTTAIHVAIALTLMGQRVATIDLDSRQKSFTRLIDGTRMDWIVVRNRLSILGLRNKRLVGQGIGELAAQLGFRCAEGLAERVIYRELFPRGLTALDNLDELTLGTKPSLSHAAARLEVMSLVEALRLPLDARGKRRAAPCSEWFATLEKPLETHDVVDG